MTKVLNLVDLDKSDIKYLPQKFPDGQQNIVIIGLLLNRGLGNDDIVKLEQN